ncbi:MAG TPA: cytochrome c maturation protein CcmE [Polyangiaceae bacterium]|nr:cytochrome c maturation protein CcmE [Polyangiaceae bacterium]
MSRVDDELLQAVADSEAAAPATAPVVSPIAAPEQRPKRNLGLLIALLAMGGGILSLVLTSFEDAAVYSRGVDQLVQEKDKLTGRNVRVDGTLVKGTLKRRDQPCEYRFSMEKKGANLDVRYAQCIVPDTFRDVPGMDVAVTAEGTLNAAGQFEATHIMAKCPSKYEMDARAKKGELAPHTVSGAGALPGETMPAAVSKPY